MPELSDPSVREVIYGPYRIIYEIFRDPECDFCLTILARRQRCSANLSEKQSCRVRPKVDAAMLGPGCWLDA